MDNLFRILLGYDAFVRRKRKRYHTETRVPVCDGCRRRLG